MTHRKQIVDRFSRGKPHWIVNGDVLDNHEVHELHADRERTWWFIHHDKGSIASVLYNEEYKGWEVSYGSCGEELLTPDREEVALFDTPDEAKRAFLRAVPKIVEGHIVCMAQLLVEEIDKELGFWRNILLPNGRRRAERWLVEQVYASEKFA
jgi:hypothetical protein